MSLRSFFSRGFPSLLASPRSSLAPRPSPLAPHSRATLIWSLVGFVVFYLLGAYLVEKGPPRGRDPEFATKFRRLQARRNEHPERPLILMLGSSRTLLMLDAGSVQVDWQGVPAQAFNFGIKGSGPMLELLCLQRLLKTGVKPDLLLLELFPALFNRPIDRSMEEIWFQEGRLRHAEMAELRQYHDDQRRIWRRWLRFRLKPWNGLERDAEDMLDPLGPHRMDHSTDADAHVVDPFGWEPHFLGGITDAERTRAKLLARNQYEVAMGPFHPAVNALAALAAVVDTCRQNGIPVVLVRMPEGEYFRSFYPPGMLEQLEWLLADFCEQRRLPLVNARDWLPEEELYDSHHALPVGAAHFTKRLQDEVLAPLLQRLPLPGELKMAHRDR
jgi:Protein of unknown function (DUF1574)